MTELIIDESNFDEYFFDVRKYGPKKGQVLAKFRARAELIEGHMKEQLVYLLSNMPNGAESAVKVMHKLGCATYSEAIRVVTEIAEDLMSGMSENDVYAKIYEYDYEQFFYTDRENVPKDNHHWSSVEILNLDNHLEKIEKVDGGEIRSKIITKNSDENL